MKIKVSDYVVKYLEYIGIKNIYSVTGGMIMYLTDSVGKSNINLVNTMCEQSAGIMAEAESIYTEELGALLTTSGPGITNAITPITSAYIDGNPMLVISGACKTEDQDSRLRQKGVQEVNAYEILTSITKQCYKIDKNQVVNLKEILLRAVHEATTGRKGPVFVEISLDAQAMELEDDIIPYFMFEDGYKFSNNIIDDIIMLLNESKKPLMLIGNGCREFRKNNRLRDIIDALSIPIQTTWKSMDMIDENDELYFGRPGSISSRYANNILQECDLLISVGSRLDLPTVAYDYDNFAKNAKKVFVDIDNNELEKLQKDDDVYYTINVDSKVFLNLLYNESYRIQDDYNDWKKWCREEKQKYPILIPDSNSNFINPYEFIQELSELLYLEDCNIVPSSSGSASEIVCQALKVREGQRVICSNGLGSMGFAVCHGIGACIASDKKHTIIIEGDGSFFMGNTAELELIKRYNLPIKIFIWNNNCYGSIRNTHNKFFGHITACDNTSGVTLPDIRNIANAYEIDYFNISQSNQSTLKVDYEDRVYDKEDTLYSQISEVIQHDKAVICEVMIDPDIMTQPKCMAYKDKEGNMVSGKLENMWPFKEDNS